MGDLVRAALVVAIALLACAVNARASPDDPNDRLWFAQLDASESPVQREADVPGGFKTAVVSWNVQTPAGSSIEVRLRARVGGRFTGWYEMGSWSADASGGARHSIDGQKDSDGEVDTDTLVLRDTADAFDVAVVPHHGVADTWPHVQLLAVATSLALEAGARTYPPSAVAMDLSVPERTQHVPTSPDAKGGGGDSWCSPASVSMVMAFWANEERHPEWDVDVATVAGGVYDPVYDGCGNWPFNVAYASEHGLAGYVRQFPGLSPVEVLVSHGIPVIASIAVKPGELDGAPYPKTAGHLLVIRGFTAEGDVIVNEPYGQAGTIKRVYRRAQFEHVWQGGSNGTVYIIAPPGVIRSLG